MPTLEENVNRVKAAKTAIANAITAKGGTVSSGDGLEDFASDIASIPSGGGGSDLIDLIERDIASINIPDTTTQIGAHAFHSCLSLTSVTMPSSVTSIDADAFRECSNLTSVTMPSSLKSISNNAFRGCFNLPSVTIPSSVTSISSSAFYGCSNLATITVNKAEDSITGAPWGANNATVVWTG